MMYVKKIIFLLILAIFVVPLTSAFANSNKPSVAIMPFSDQSPRKGVITQNEINDIRLDIETDIVQTGKFRLLTRTEIDKLLAEIQFDNSGLVDPATAAEYGKMIGANYLMLGTITGVSESKGKNFIVNVSLRMIEVETAEIFLAGRGTGKSKKTALEALQKATEDALRGQRGMLTMLRGRA